MLLILDNYDSFTYNLVQAFGSLGAAPAVRRNDRTTLEEIERLKPQWIVISPGPKTPSDAGLSCELVRTFAGRVPILGVCLGHQCIAQAFGARICPAAVPRHGKCSLVRHDGRSVFAGLPSPMSVMRYHSLIVDERTLPGELVVTARSESGEPMGLRHIRWPVEGVQFHPESYRTPEGTALLRNFLALTA